MNSVIDELLARYRPTIERSLADASKFGSGCPARLGDAIRYGLLAPGKRLRPTLVMMASEACGGEIDSACPSAVAVEMIHAYSLIHDDLPAMDDDDLRRGRPTTHIEFGEATAILAGDALQSEAFAHLYRATQDPMLACALIGELAIAAGACGLVGGQEDDLAAENLSLDDFDSPLSARLHLESIHRRKTGALFVASARMGAISARACPEAVDALGRFAELFGLAFQITDDVLDLTATDEQLGKRTQKDVGRGKFTFPYLMAAENGAFLPGRTFPESQRGSSTSMGGADGATTVNHRENPSGSGQSYAIEANAIQASVDWQAGIELARSHAGGLVQEAHESLALLGPTGERFHNLADYILERTS